MSRPAEEPRVLTDDVRRILRRVIRPDDPDEGEAVQRFAERADTSTRTIYRVLSGTAGSSTTPPSLLLPVADRLVVAAGAHLWETHVLLASGEVLEYGDA